MPSIDGDRTDRACRAEVLAGAAADAALLVHHRTAIAGFLVFHQADGAGGAVAGAVAALHAFLHHAESGIHAGRAHMVLRLLLLGDSLDGPGRAEFRAAGAFRAAVAALVGHLGLHQVLEVRRRTEHVVRAFGHAQLAGGAAAVEILHAFGSGRRDGNVALRHFLVQKHGEPAVHLLLLGAQRGAAHGQRRPGDERPAAGRLLRFARSDFLLLPPCKPILQPT